MSIDKTNLYNRYYIQLRGVTNRLEKRDLFSRLFVRKPEMSNYKIPADSIDWKPFIGRIAAVVNDAAEERKFCVKWITEKKFVWRKEKKLYFCCSESGHRAQNYLYLPVKRPMASAETNNKKKAIKITVANNKKAARPQVKEVLDSESASAFNLENE